MKLIIQLPCYNEEKTLLETLKDLPSNINGIETIEYLVINDGSSDSTYEVAKNYGVHHIINIPINKGLANAFKTGLDSALTLGADIIVNTDGDNQYDASDIEKIVKPILLNKADIVIGERQIEAIEHFSFIKKKLQRFGSWVVRKMSGVAVNDATSGFRAFSKDAALRLNVLSSYTYTLETIIQAGLSNQRIFTVPIKTNPGMLRESRLIKNVPSYIYKSVITIIRFYMFYKPLRFFVAIGFLLAIIAASLFARFILLVFIMELAEGRTYLPSLVTASSLLVLACLTIVLGLLADLIAHNRKINEEMLYKMKKAEIEKEIMKLKDK